MRLRYDVSSSEKPAPAELPITLGIRFRYLTHVKKPTLDMVLIFAYLREHQIQPQSLELKESKIRASEDSLVICALSE